MSKDSISPEEKNARMNEDREFLTKLLESSLEGNFDTVKQHIEEYHAKHPAISEREVLAQFRDGNKRTALHFMCSSASPDILDKLVKWFDSDKNFLISLLKLKDSHGLTALMICAQHSDAALACQRVKLLLDVGGKQLALARSNAGAGALHYAAGAGALPDTIHALVKAGKVALSISSLKGGTPLHWVAALRGDYTQTTLGALVECGADLNTLNKSGLSPLLLAAAAGNDKHAKYLVQQGADVTLQLPGNITIYHMAADCNLIGTLTELLERYPEQKLASQKNARGEAPVDLAVHENHIESVMLLTGEGDADKAKAWMEERKKTLPEPFRSSIQPAAAPEPNNSPQYNFLEETARQMATKAATTSVSEEDKVRALAIKSEGNQHFANKEWQAAIDKYTEAIEVDPTDAKFYSNRSACYMEVKKYHDALQDAVICRQLLPQWSKACYRMAVARLALELYEDAALSAWEGLNQDEENEELRRLLQECIKKGRKEHQARTQTDHAEESS